MGRTILVSTAAVAYPIMTHIAVARHSEALTVASVAVLATLVLAPGLARGSRPAMLAVPVVIGAIVVLVRLNLASLPLYAPPVLITGFAAWLFGRTLVPASTPLIEQFARLMRPSGQALEQQLVDYTRKVTIVWTALLIILCVSNLLLALLAVPTGLLTVLGIQPPLAVPQSLWSLSANVLDYVLLAGLFVGEYVYRRLRFPNLPYTGLIDFIKRAARLRPGSAALKPRAGPATGRHS